MILHTVLHKVRPEDGFRNLGVVTIDRGRVVAYRIERRGTRCVLTGRRLGPATTNDPPGYSPPSLDVSPSGTLVALVSRKGRDDTVAVLDAGSLRVMGSWHVAVPGAADRLPITAVAWSPDSRHLYVRFPRGDGMLTDVRGRRRVPVARGQAWLAWSRSGQDLDVLNEGESIVDARGLAWTRYGVEGGRKGLVDFAKVRRSSWYGSGLRNSPQALDMRGPTWTPRGAFWPNVRSDHDLFAIDLAVDARGTHRLRRKGVLNVAADQRYLGDRVVYLQGLRLFGDEEVADGAEWLGVWDVRSGRRRQIPLFPGRLIDADLHLTVRRDAG